MATQTNFTRREINTLIRRYKAGEGSKALAEWFDVSPGTILRILRDEGIRIRKQGRPRLS